LFYLGLDLGQRRDPSAIAVVERGRDQRLLVRHLERIPLGTSYPRVVARVKKLLALDELRGNCSVAADAAGVGAQVMDMLRDARLGCDIASVTITSGEKESQSGQTWNGRERLGADGYGEHDDLVIALALGCWRAGKSVVRYGESPRRFRPG